MGKAISVLVVDDSALMRKVIKGMLADEGDFVVETARNGVDALERVKAVEPDVVTLDINMPEMDGLTCLSEIMRDSPRPVVMVSSLTDHGARTTIEALELGAVDYVPKPGGTVSLNLDEAREELVAKVRRAAKAKVRATGGLADRLRRQRERLERGAAAPTTVPGAGTARYGERPLAGGPSQRVLDSRARRHAAVPIHRKATDIELVLVGSSTGGPQALSEVIGGLPAAFPSPVVIAQHIPAAFTRHLAERLSAESPFDVHEVTSATSLLPGNVYIGRGDADILIGRRADGLVAKSVPASESYRWHPSVDRMVTSALQYVDASKMIGVLLTGMGDDGADQLAELKRRGGRTVAESEDTAVVWGMPGELTKRGGATKVLPLQSIATQISTWV